MTGRKRSEQNKYDQRGCQNHAILVELVSKTLTLNFGLCMYDVKIHNYYLYMPCLFNFLITHSVHTLPLAYISSEIPI